MADPPGECPVLALGQEMVTLGGDRGPPKRTRRAVGRATGINAARVRRDSCAVTQRRLLGAGCYSDEIRGILELVQIATQTSEERKTLFVGTEVISTPRC